MEKTHSIKQAVIDLIFKQFGQMVGKSFSNAYEQEPLPNFLNQALIILEESIGKPKAIEQINYILIKSHKEDLMIYE